MNGKTLVGDEKTIDIVIDCKGCHERHQVMHDIDRMPRCPTCLKETDVVDAATCGSLNRVTVYFHPLAFGGLPR